MLDLHLNIIVNWEIYLVALTLLLALVGFASDRVSLAVVAGGILIVLLLACMAGSPQLPFTLWEGLLWNPAPLTILSMFVLSAGLERCGLIDIFAKAFSKTHALPYRTFIGVLIVCVALISAFMNNTPVVVILTPVVISLARQMGKSPSKVLIPLSYASIFGGMCTLVGSSTNILASGVLQDHQLPELGMFELGKIGLPGFVLATIYFVTFGQKRLPERDTLTSLLPKENRREFVTEAVLAEDSVLAGQCFSKSKASTTGHMRLLELVRNGRSLEDAPENIPLHVNDMLVVASPSADLTYLTEEGVSCVQEQKSQHSQEALISEAIVSPISPLIGKTITEAHFRKHYRTSVLAIHRRGQQLYNHFKEIPLRLGDALLLVGPAQDLEALSREQGLGTLDASIRPIRSGKRHQIYLMVMLMMGFVLTASFQVLPISVLAVGLAAILLLTGILPFKEAFQSVQWSIILLIYSMLALGSAMESTGATRYITEYLTESVTHFPESWRLHLTIAMLYFATNVLTELLSNQATILLMAPIAIGLAAHLGVDSRPFVITTCVAASASFAFPLGYQTNTYIYNAGGYRFKDFFRVGLPLNLLYGVLCVVMVPLIWSF